MTVAPSATVWGRLSRDSAITVRTVGCLAGPRLARGVAEASDVATIWSNAGALTTATNVSASVDLTTRVLGEADIVHIAAHGHHAEDNPLFSSLLMADGPLFAHELINGVQARHVILSACDVGRSRIRAGGEALGLTAALLALGTQTVIAAVAPYRMRSRRPPRWPITARLFVERMPPARSRQAIAATPGAEALCCFGGSLRVTLS